MPVPKCRKSKSKRDMRRANHDKLTPPNLSSCSHCQEPTLPHRVCPSCGFYKGKARLEQAAPAAED